MILKVIKILDSSPSVVNFGHIKILEFHTISVLENCRSYYVISAGFTQLR